MGGNGARKMFGKKHTKPALPLYFPTLHPIVFTMRISNIFRFLVGCFVFLRLVPCSADSWLAPSTFEVLSDNKQFIARVVPATTNAKPQLLVLTVSKGRTNQLWASDLGNKVSPNSVLISDDGSSVVTLDNWGRGGYGDDVIAFYTRAGRMAKYSLEQIAPPPRRTENSFQSLGGRDGYGGVISHSTASRHWQRNSLQFFAVYEGELWFCLWLDWDDRWLVWRASDGAVVNPTLQMLTLLNAAGRRRALKLNSGTRFSESALAFLARLRIPQDKPLIEFWLNDTNFSMGTAQKSGPDMQGTVFTFFSHSHSRDAADKALARWNGKKSFEEIGLHQRYDYLGTLNGVVRFPVPPAKGEGSIYIHLIPESKPLSDWASIPAAQYLAADLRVHYPHIFLNGGMQDAALPADVNFAINGVTPGDYRVKVVWDKVKPFARSGEVLYKPQPGDYESTNSPVITIQSGSTNTVQVECKTLVEGLDNN
jgi:hypothetical protein